MTFEERGGLLYGVYDTVGRWLAYHLRDDDGRCDQCGDRRGSPAYVRREASRPLHYLLPDIGRYCYDCAVDESTSTTIESAAKDRGHPDP